MISFTFKMETCLTSGANFLDVGVIKYLGRQSSVDVDQILLVGPGTSFPKGLDCCNVLCNAQRA